MRALTLTQPWAGLVASGIKLVENRPRSVIKREDFGKPFGIHASREINIGVFDRIHEIAPELDWCRPRLGRCHLRADHDGPHWLVRDSLLAPSPPSWAALGGVTSAVIAVATVTRRVMRRPGGRMIFDPNAPDEEIDLGDQLRWFFGPIGYLLDADIRALATPVRCPGHQGFWHMSDAVEQQVLQALAQSESVVG